MAPEQDAKAALVVAAGVVVAAVVLAVAYIWFPYVLAYVTVLIGG